MTDLQEDLNSLIKSINIDLDKFFAAGVEYDRGYMEGQMEIVFQLLEIIKRYED